MNPSIMLAILPFCGKMALMSGCLHVKCIAELVWMHAGIVQEAGLSMVHLGSNKASEQHTLWQVSLLHAVGSTQLPSTFSCHTA